MFGVSDQERSIAIDHLLDEEESRLFKHPRDGELDLLLSEALPALRRHCAMEAWAGNWLPGRLSFIAFDAKTDLSLIQQWLKAPGTFTEGDPLLARPAIELWRVWTNDAFDASDRRWLDDRGQRQLPAELSRVNVALGIYERNSLIRQPYVSWALINSYLLSVGFEERSRLQKDIVELIDDSGVEFLDGSRNAVSAAVVSHILYMHLVKAEFDDLASLRSMFFEAGQYSVKEILTAAILACSGFVYSLSLGVMTMIVAPIALRLAISRRKGRIHAAGIVIEKLLIKEGPILQACRRAWICANSPVVNLAELRSRVNDLAQTMKQSISPIQWLIDDCAERYGDGIDVRGFLEGNRG